MARWARLPGNYFLSAGIRASGWGTGSAKNQRDKKPALHGAGAMIKLDKRKLLWCLECIFMKICNKY